MMQSVSFSVVGQRSLAVQRNPCTQRLLKTYRGVAASGVDRLGFGSWRATNRVSSKRSSWQVSANWQQAHKADAVPVVFTIEQKVELGDKLILVGDHADLGNWDVGSAAQLTWGEGHIWETALWLSPGTTMEFKCVRAGNNGDCWEKGRNRVLSVPADAVSKMTVALTWSGEMEVLTQEEKVQDQPGGFSSWDAVEEKPVDSSTSVPVTISFQREVGMGQSHVLVGSHPSMGEWKTGNGAQMKWEEGHVWRSNLELEPGASLEFKCVEVGSNGEYWERGLNRVLNIPSHGVSSVAVDLQWGADMMVTAQPAEAQSQPAQQHSWEEDQTPGSRWDSATEDSKPFDWGSWGQAAEEEAPAEPKVATPVAKAAEDSSSVNKLLEEAATSLEAERQFSERMMAALRSVKQQASDANEKWAKAEKLLRAERNRIKELEGEVQQLRRSFSQASDAVVQMREEISSLQQQLSQSNGGNSSSSWDDSKQTRVNGRPKVNGHNSKWSW